MPTEKPTMQTAAVPSSAPITAGDDTTITPQQEAALAKIVALMQEDGHDITAAALIARDLPSEICEFWEDSEYWLAEYAAFPGAIIVYRDPDHVWPSNCEYMIADTGLIMAANGVVM